MKFTTDLHTARISFHLGTCQYDPYSLYLLCGKDEAAAQAIKNTCYNALFKELNFPVQSILTAVMIQFSDIIDFENSNFDMRIHDIDWFGFDFKAEHGSQVSVYFTFDQTDAMTIRVLYDSELMQELTVLKDSDGKERIVCVFDHELGHLYWKHSERHGLLCYYLTDEVTPMFVIGTRKFDFSKESVPVNSIYRVNDLSIDDSGKISYVKKGSFEQTIVTLEPLTHAMEYINDSAPSLGYITKRVDDNRIIDSKTHCFKFGYEDQGSILEVTTK